MSQTQRPSHHELLWESLATSGAISAELIQELKQRWTPDSWKPLGELLLRDGKLTVRQVAGLLGVQAEEPHVRIGDLAVREGFCSRAEIEQALQDQRDRCPGPIDILLQDQRVERDELLDALLRYVRFLEGRVLSD